MPDTGPFSGPPTSDWWDNPEYKLYLRGAGAGRGGPGGQRPGSGGGFATFGGGMNTLSGGSALGQPGWMRRTPYENVSMAAQPTNAMTGLRQASSVGPMTSSGGLSSMIQRLMQQSIAATQAAAQQSPSNNNQPLTWGQAANNTDPGWAGTFWRTLAPFGLGGTFGTTGSSDVANAIEAQGNRLAGGAYNRAQKQAQLMGLDPGASASYAMEAGLRGQSDTANAIQNAQLQQMLAAQEWARNILGSYLGANTAAGATDSINRYRTDAQSGGGSGWGQTLGSAAGSLINLLPTLGW